MRVKLESVLSLPNPEAKSLSAQEFEKRARGNFGVPEDLVENLKIIRVAQRDGHWHYTLTADVDEDELEDVYR